MHTSASVWTKATTYWRWCVTSYYFLYRPPKPTSMQTPFTTGNQHGRQPTLVEGTELILILGSLSYFIFCVEKHAIFTFVSDFDTCTSNVQIEAKLSIVLYTD